jgi:hypothetical protein
MELAEALQWALGAGLAVIGWFARVLWGAVQELKDDLASIKADLPIHYVRKDDFREFRHNVMDALQRIETLLYQKQDRV